MPERPKFTVACDFDGFMTNLIPGAKEYYDAYVKAFGKRFKTLNPNFDEEEARYYLNAGLRTVYRQPGRHGWDNDGKKVAHAESDPTQLAKAAGQIALDYLGMQHKYKTPSKKDVNKFLGEVFEEAYKLDPIFREGALEFIEKLKENPNIRLIFVTNSKPDAVKEKLKLLLATRKTNLKLEDIEVIADAKKQDVDDKWKKVKAFIRIPGIPGKIFTRRKQYGETLIREDADMATGDNAVLDIITPALMGLYTLLLDTDALDNGPIILTDEVIPPKKSKNVRKIERDYIEKKFGTMVFTELGLAAQAIIRLA